MADSDHQRFPTCGCASQINLPFTARIKLVTDRPARVNVANHINWRTDVDIKPLAWTSRRVTPSGLGTFSPSDNHHNGNYQSITGIHPPNSLNFAPTQTLN